jgi:hypothetical protein
LDTLGGSEQARIDGCGADCGADFPHGFPDCVEKGTAGVLSLRGSDSISVQALVV